MPDIAPRRYACRACGRIHPGWTPRCTGCLAMEVGPVAFNVDVITSAAPRLVAVPDAEAPDVPAQRAASQALVVASSAPIQLSEVPEQSFMREKTGLPPLDDVLGGGLVLGSVVVLGGEPGSGKSSCVMQALAGLAMRCLYATGEESIAQAAGRARRIGADSTRVWIVAETDLDTVLEHAKAVRAEILAVDSIQTLSCGDFGGSPGSPGQVRECTRRLVQFAKATDTSVWLIGHVTNDGALAGPKTLKHLVDVVLEIEVGTRRKGTERILRCAGKNRFGPGNVVGHFELTSEGLIPLEGEDPEDAEPSMPELPQRP